MNRFTRKIPSDNNQVARIYRRRRLDDKNFFTAKITAFAGRVRVP